MTLAPEESDRTGSSIFNPVTGKKSRGLKEKVEFGKLQEQARARREETNLRKHLDKRHPTGLAQLKTSSGEVIRKSGTPAKVG